MVALRLLGKIATISPGLVSPERFVGALGDKHPQVRATAVQVLASLGASWLTDDLIVFLIKKLTEVVERNEGEQRGEKNKPEREDGLVRLAIMQLVVTLGERRAVLALVVQLDDKEDWQIREAAILALGSFLNVLSPPQREKLCSKLYDENYFVREAAIIVLQGRWPIDELLHDLRTSTGPERAQAARILGELGVPTLEIVRALLEVAMDAQARSAARAGAILSLKRLRFRVGGTELEAWLQGSDEEMRSAAAISADALYPGQYGPRK